MRPLDTARFSLGLGAVLLLATPARAQSLTTLAQEGDPQAGASPIDHFVDIAVLDNGHFAYTAVGGPTQNVLSIDNQTTLLVGAATQIPGVFLVDFVDLQIAPVAPGCLQPVGVFVLDASTVTSSDDRAFCFGSQVLFREGDVTTAAEVPSGTTYGELHRSALAGPDSCILLATLNTPSGARDAVLEVRFDADPSCTTATLQSVVVLQKEGDLVPPENRPLAGLATTAKHSFAMNTRGDYMYIGRFDVGGFLERRVILNGSHVLRENGTPPAGSGKVTQLHLGALDINDLGDYAIQTNTNNLNQIERAIYKGSSLGGAPELFVQTGDSVADPFGTAYVIDRIGKHSGAPEQAERKSPVLVTNSGDIVWYVEGSESPFGNLLHAIVVNHEAVIDFGSDVPGTLGITRIGDIAPDRLFRNDMEVSPNGRYLVACVKVLPVVGPQEEHLVQMDLGESVPYGTQAQGCSTYAYPSPRLEQRRGEILANGMPTGFPRINATHRITMDGPYPTGTTVQVLAYYATPHASPCGQVIGPGFSVLVGSGSPVYITSTFQNVGGQKVFDITLPNDLGLVGLVSYAQAFHLDASLAIIGGTNAIRFVYGL